MGVLPIGVLPIGVLPIGVFPIGVLPIGVLPIGVLPIGTKELPRPLLLVCPDVRDGMRDVLMTGFLLPLLFDDCFGSDPNRPENCGVLLVTVPFDEFIRLSDDMFGKRELFPDEFFIEIELPPRDDLNEEEPPERPEEFDMRELKPPPLLPPPKLIFR